MVYSKRHLILGASLSAILVIVLSFQNCAKSLPPESGGLDIGSQSTFSFNLDSQYVEASGTTPLRVLGGVAPITYSIVNGSGALNGAEFIAPATTGANTLLRATDRNGRVAEASLTVLARFVVSAAASRVQTGAQVQITATGGLPPYEYFVTQNASTISETGLFTAGTSPGPAIVHVTDARGIITRTLNLEVYREVASTNVFASVGTQTFTVPADVSVVQIKAWGAGGGAGGAGGFVQSRFAVTPGQVLTIHVAGAGGHPGSYASGGGGGASAVLRGTQLLIVAGGGGGGNYAMGGAGGNPGGAGGAHNSSQGGAGGTASAPGAGGTGYGGTGQTPSGVLQPGGHGSQNGCGLGGGAAGGFGYPRGGDGGLWGACTIVGGTAGGGGGGYYSGGGGGAGLDPYTGGGAGGGGSNFVDASGSAVEHVNGSGGSAPNTGDVHYAGSAGASGNAGRVVINSGANITP